MTAITWNPAGERFFEVGVSKGVLYLNADNWRGVPWNGLTEVNTQYSGLSKNPLYLDGVKYHIETSGSDFAGSISAYTYPTEFETHQLDGSKSLDGLIAYNQPSNFFAICWRTEIGNDTTGLDFGYKLHILYNAYATPNDNTYQTINDSPEALELQWDLECLPIIGFEHTPTSYFTLDSRTISPGYMKVIENILYGTTQEDARLLFPIEIIELLNDDMNEIPIVESGYGLSMYGIGLYGV